MIHYARCGQVSRRAHAELHLNGELQAEHVFTREGFDDLYSILYQKRAPTHEVKVSPLRMVSGFQPSSGGVPQAPLRAHYRTGKLVARQGQDFLGNRMILMQNSDCTVGVCHTETQQEDFFQNGDADEVFFVAEGGGTLETVFGELPYLKHDYVVVPRGVPYRFRFSSPQRLLCVEAFRGFGLPKPFLNHRGQLKLDAPYNERDFRIPTQLLTDSVVSPNIVVCRNRTLSQHSYTEWPYHVVGWDGFVYPFALNVHDYKPKTSTYHLPPTSHCVFEAQGFVMMNFVPRLVDYGEGAIPCPYPHSSVDCDEVLYYVEGDFTSRRGIEQHSVSWHPAGVPHGPHPEKYEKSIGVQRTSELAIMVDTFAPLCAREEAEVLRDPDYHYSWNTKEHL